jgi:hypothetical protein
MVPPIVTDEEQGQLIDGKPRSAYWRAKNAELEAAKAAKQAPSDSATGNNDPYSPPTGFAGSVMIPADQLARGQDDGPDEPRQRSPVHQSDRPEDPYIDNLVASVAETDTTDEATETETDRFFEREAVAPPRAAVRQALGTGTASLDIDSTTAQRRHTKPRSLGVRPRITRGPRSGQERRSPKKLRAIGLVVAAAVGFVVIAMILITGRGGGSAQLDRSAKLASVQPVSLAALSQTAGAADSAIHRLAQSVVRPTHEHQPVRKHRVRHQPQGARHPAHRPATHAKSTIAASTQPANHNIPVSAPTSSTSTPSASTPSSSSSTPSVVSSSPSTGATVSSPAAPPSSSETSSGGATSSHGSGQSSKSRAPAGPTGNGALLGPGHCNC